MLADWEGSTRYTRFLSDNMGRAGGINIPYGKFYLGDVGYACLHGFIPTFRKIIYHFNEFCSRIGPNNANELFNLRHYIIRVMIERAFVALKNIFNILD